MTIADRKFQVSNGYLLDCDQLARVLHHMLEHPNTKKITRQALSEDTGLANRQVEGLVSLGTAMGLVQPGRQTLTDTGTLVAKNDMFLEAKGTLEWCHYVAATSFKNLVWYEIFNSLLVHEPPMLQDQWVLHFRNLWAGQYSNRTMGKGLREEVRLVVDAYTNQNFSRLSLLQQTSDDRLYRRRYSGFEPPILAAMAYDYAERNQTHLFRMRDLSEQPGAPGFVFGVEATGFRQELEALHDVGWVRYETTHGLDQFRLKADLMPLCFLRAYYENSEPVSVETETKEGLF